MLVYLTGMRGSGKTTTGRLLAQALGCPFVDLDEMLVKNSGQEISEFVASKGWPEFRALESATLQQASRLLGTAGVCATGGGIVLSEMNRKYMQEHGLIVLLAPPVHALHDRLSKNPLPGQRPAFTSSPLYAELCELWKQREELYRECAHLIFEECVEPACLAEKICHRIKRAVQNMNGM